MTVSAPFRPEAEARLKRPEQLTTALRLVSPGYGLAVVMLALLVVGALVAATVVKVPIVVKGTGVILSSKGVLEVTIASEHDGRVLEMMVDVGRQVVPGQAIARIVQPALQRELKLAESEHQLIVQEQTRIRDLQASVMAQSDDMRRQQEENTRESIRLLEARLQMLEQLAAAQEPMRQSGNVTIDRYLNVRADLADARERLATRRGQLLGIVLERTEKQGQNEREMQALDTRRAQAERQISRLKDRIQNETIVRSAHHGIVSELKVLPGDLIRFDTPLVSLLPVDETFGELRPGQAHLVAAVLVPAKDGKKVYLSMPVLVNPTSVRRDVYGAVQGVVRKASNVPASPEQLRQMLRNDDLVRKLTESGPPFIVTVEMTRDPRTRSGLSWTTSAGPDAPITAGTLLEAEIQTERVPVISLLIPALKGLLRGPNQGLAS
jgi:HlyD family secretion protein